MKPWPRRARRRRNMDYKEWVEEVRKAFQENGGDGLEDLSGEQWHDYFEEGYTPWQAFVEDCS